VTDGSAQLSGFGTVIADMTVAAARYHVTATVLVHDGGPVASPELSGGRITTIQCDLKSGSTVLTSARTSIDLGGYASVALDDVLDASAAGAPGVDISVSCSGSGPDSIGSATIVADSMVSIVILP
jgi:hypothetical protein